MSSGYLAYVPDLVFLWEEDLFFEARSQRVFFFFIWARVGF